MQVTRPRPRTRRRLPPAPSRPPPHRARDGQILNTIARNPDGSLSREPGHAVCVRVGFPTHDLRGLQVGALVCWDQWFPEAARLCSLAGARMLFYPTAIGWQFDEGAAVDTAQHEAWETVQRAHAISNGVFVVAVNRVGFEPTDPTLATDGAESGQGIRFWG